MSEPTEPRGFEPVPDGAGPIAVVIEEKTTTWVQVGLELLSGRAAVRQVHRKLTEDRTGFDGRLEFALEGAVGFIAAPWCNGSLPNVTRAFLTEHPELRVIAGTFDNRFSEWLDLEAAGDAGVRVIDTSRTMAPSMAEYALGMTINALRNLPAAVQLIREGSWKNGTWDLPAEFVQGDLAGKCVGIAGFGSIGRYLSRLLAPFGCTISTFDPFVADDDIEHAGVAPTGSLNQLAASSEIFVVAIPPTPATLGVIDAEVIAALRPGALMLVITRMAVIEQEALWDRCMKGEIRVVADVFDPEPPPTGAWFRESPWVIPTPHVAADTTYCHSRCFTVACEEALSVLEGGASEYEATIWDDKLYRGDVRGLTG